MFALFCAINSPIESSSSSQTSTMAGKAFFGKFVAVAGKLLYLCMPCLLAVLLSCLSASSAVAGSTLLVSVGLLCLTRRPRPVYLLDFACVKPSAAYAATRGRIMAQFTSAGEFTDETVAFQRRMLERCGIGDAAYIPASLLSRPVEMTFRTAREEAEAVVFPAVDEVLRKTGLAARDVGIVVTNCSVYTPTPSYAAMIVNRYKMRSDVVSYNLAGMGCSAGLIAIDLVKHLLQVHPNNCALVVSTENITLNAYLGNNRSMLVTNSLFRMGGAAILLSNRRCDRRRAHYQLLHAVRTHRGADDRSYSCVTQAEDGEGKLGIALSKDLMAVAGAALKANISTLGPLVLPFSEQLLFLAAVLLKKVFKARSGAAGYVPDFKAAFEHFCVHAGGRAVLEELEKSLRLSPWHMEPSRMTLYRFGNTSSSSLWYELAYCEAKGRIRSGDRVWQIAFGSGFKCNSAVWRSLKKIETANDGKSNPWWDEITEFPVHVPKEVPLAP
ncbi:putative 3-ketoacyl-CoA synthase 20 [Curcuma longa]|uniref:putative 3-ketoacyl-CoA synthase 20 n=1 Tax=Curcuma longa TaxID=136217 RepID=UPI003D9EEBBD